MNSRKKIINELRFQLYSKEVTDEHYPVQLSASDATAILALLKEQEPRVLTLYEVKAAKGHDMYLEIRGYGYGDEYITAATLDGVGTRGVNFYHSVFDFECYGKATISGWRCWTARPTEEQRKEVKWND